MLGGKLNLCIARFFHQSIYLNVCVWLLKKGGLSSGVEIYTFMFILTLSGLSIGVGLSKGVPHVCIH